VRSSHVGSSHMRRSRGPVPCTCFLLGLPEHPQVPAFDRTLQINTIEPMASRRRGRGWGSQTLVRGSAVGRRPVCAGHEKYGKESNQSDPSSETRKHGCDRVALRESDRAAKPPIIHADAASRTVHLSPPMAGIPPKAGLTASLMQHTDCAIPLERFPAFRRQRVNQRAAFQRDGGCRDIHLAAGLAGFHL
jgi:hypothetical protein